MIQATLFKELPDVAEIPSHGKHRPYPQYAPSECRWLGDLPSHWKTRRLKFVAKSQPSNVDKKSVDGEMSVRLCNYVDVYKNDYITPDLDFMQSTCDPSELAKFRLRHGDVLITKDSEEWNDIAVPAFVTQDLDDVACGYHLSQVRPHAGVMDGEYLFRAFRAGGVSEQFQVSANGVTRFGIPAGAIGDVMFPVPPLDEQRSIARFLREDTSRIDRLITDKIRLIDLLAEKRAAVITHAVTKGLNPKASTKETGIDWLGQIPSHWSLKKLKHVSHLQTGLTLGKKYDEETRARLVTRPYLRVANVQDGWLDLDEITEVAVPKDAVLRYELQAGDVLMTEGGDFDKLGRGYVWEGQIPGCLHQNHIFAVRPNKRLLDSHLLATLLSSHHGRNYFTKTSQQTTNLASTNSTKLGEFPVPLASFDEQQDILRFIAEFSHRFDLLSRDVSTAINRLREYRSALITAAVTAELTCEGRSHRMATHAEDRTRLAQAAMIGQLHKELPIGEMLTVYLSDRSPRHDHAIFCALIPTKQIEKSISDPAWDLSQGQGLPGAVRYGLGDDAKVEYLRFGNTDGVEPLIFVRGYHGVRDDCLEISEEFRHFHRLCRNKANDHYIKFDGDGNEEVVAVVEPNRVRIRLKEIRQFLAIKEMHLALMFDCREHSEHPLKDLGMAEAGEDFRKELSCWGLHYGDFGGMDSWRGFSRFLGKRLIPPVAKEKSGFWGYAKEEPKKYVDFIIGQDEDGGEILHTSDPDKLSNYFGANPGSPHYLTPVQFKKQVLDKYYQQPSKFSVESGYLRCGGLWGMCMDNHFDDRVAAWLGDLGRDLPYGEQLHWRSYNIPPVGGVSKTYFQRQIMAVATDSDRPEHEFQRQYERLNIAGAEILRWSLLLPLTQEDHHFFKAIRVPATDEQKDFDELVLAMTKILVDSLNEKELNKLIPEAERGDIKGSISRLERACATAKVANANGHIEFLRKLQNLRSAGTAHCKGSNYEKIAQEFQVDSQSLRRVFEGILVKGIRLLEFLEATVRSGSFGTKVGGVT